MNAAANAYDLADAVIRRSGIMTDIYADRSPENMSRQENVQRIAQRYTGVLFVTTGRGHKCRFSIRFLAEVSLAIGSGQR